MNNIDHFDLTIAEESRRTDSSFCAISGNTFGRESVLTYLVPYKPVAPSVGSINVVQRVVENPLVEGKNKILTYEIHNTNEDVSFREQVKDNTLSPTMNFTGKNGCKTSEASSLEQVRTSYKVYNTEGRIRSEGLNNLYHGIGTNSQKARILIVHVIR